jgi:uncharacterized protein YqeY
MANLKDKLRNDLSTAIKSRDELTSATIRLTLTAISTTETAGKQARELSDEEVVEVIAKEAKRRREAAEAYDEAQRPELAVREREELAVLERYLPEALTETEIDAIVAQAVAEVAASGVTGGKAIGEVMKRISPKTKGRVDGGLVASKVKAALG